MPYNKSITQRRRKRHADQSSATRREHDGNNCEAPYIRGEKTTKGKAGIGTISKS